MLAITGNKGAAGTNVVPWPGQTVRDASGSRIFAAGDMGMAHVIAHRLHDTARYGLGRAWLGEWLDRHAGTGGDWIHLQFHMAVFELATGDWAASYGRFLEQVMPAAATTRLALTDAPGLAWRLKLAAAGPAVLNWDVLGQTARASIETATDRFVTLHHLLALAGAGDAGAITHWLGSTPHRRDPDWRAVVRTAKALLAALDETFDDAAMLLAQALPELDVLGGSRAQNGLFIDLVDAWRRRPAPRLEADYRNAA